MSEPIVKATPLKVIISIVPIFAGVVIRLLDESIGVDPGKSLGQIGPEFWNLSFDMLFTAVGVYFGAALFSAQAGDARGIRVIGVILFVGVFILIFLNMVYPHIGWYGGDNPLAVTWLSNLCALALLGMCVHST